MTCFSYKYEEETNIIEIIMPSSFEILTFQQYKTRLKLKNI